MSLSRLVTYGNHPQSVNGIMIALKDELIGKRSVPKINILLYLFPPNRPKNVYHLLEKVREMIYGCIQSMPESQQIRDHICSELQKTDLLVILIEKLPNLAMEGMKDIALIYEYAIGQQIGTRFPIVEYIVSKPIIVEMLVHYYANHYLVTICGQIIREFLRFEELTELFFKRMDIKTNEKLYLKFLDYLKTDSFVVCADIFATLHQLFCRHKTLAKEVLQTDYKQFFGKLNNLLISEDYYIRRKSIKLLNEILYDRNHQKVMKEYVIHSSNLSIITNILKSDCFYPSFDAFLIFYLFVKNPKMSSSVKEVFMRDKNSLIEFIESFQKDRPNVRQYDNEKTEVIKILKEFK